MGVIAESKWRGGEQKNWNFAKLFLKFQKRKNLTAIYEKFSNFQKSL